MKQRAPSFLGHPPGLVTLFVTEMWERFTFYGMRALLILFMTAAPVAGGLGMDPRSAGAIYGLYIAAAYLFCLPGGWLADRMLGPRRAVFWGGMLIAAGNLLLTIPLDTRLFYCGLLVVAFGVGLLKPNVSVMVGELYANESDARRDAGFSIFYFGISLGAFLAPLVAGTIGETLGYRWGFFTAAIAMLLGLMAYRVFGRSLGDAGRGPQLVPGQTPGAQWRRLLGGLGVLVLFAVLLFQTVGSIDVVQLANIVGVAMVVLAALFFGYVLLFGRLDPAERKRVAAILVFFLCGALFIAGLEQAGSSMNLFARDHTNRALFGECFAAGQHPASWYQSLGPVFVLLLTPAFVWMWVAFERRGRGVSAPIKFGVGLALLGVSFIVMTLASLTLIDKMTAVLPSWLVAAYFLQTLGELCTGPIGLSNVTKLAPRRYVSQMMGVWFLGAAVGSLVAGLIAGLIGTSSVVELPRQFFTLAVIGIGAGILVLLFAERVRSWMGRV